MFILELQKHKKNHHFPLRMGLLFVFVCLFVFINHAKLYPYLMPFSCFHLLDLIFLSCKEQSSNVLMGVEYYSKGTRAFQGLALLVLHSRFGCCGLFSLGPSPGLCFP